MKRVQAKGLWRNDGRPFAINTPFKIEYMRFHLFFLISIKEIAWLVKCLTINSNECRLEIKKIKKIDVYFLKFWIYMTIHWRVQTDAGCNINLKKIKSEIIFHKLIAPPRRFYDIFWFLLKNCLPQTKNMR